MKNFIKNLISKVENQYKIIFKPTKEFYKVTKINQKQWQKIVANQAQPNIEQIYKLCEIFEVLPEEIIQFPKQTELFEAEKILIKTDKSKLEEFKNFISTKLGNKQQEEIKQVIEFLNLEQ